MGHPAYRVTRGSIRLAGEDVTDWATDVRAKAGIFLAFQYPESISGVSVTQFLRQAMSARKGEEVSALEVRFAMTEWMERLGMDPSFAERHLNEGFSGGERKRNEILQMALLEPRLALLDETDSGLDIDALRVVGRGVHTVREERPELGVLVVTHYQRILEDLVPDRVHLLVGGRVVESGAADLAALIESEGYDRWRT
jgi:Fe-S cluster assembly ATP-binding protein